MLIMELKEAHGYNTDNASAYSMLKEIARISSFYRLVPKIRKSVLASGWTDIGEKIIVIPIMALVTR